MKKDETLEINGAFIERGTICEKTGIEDGEETAESATSAESSESTESAESATSAESDESTESAESGGSTVTNAVYGVKSLDRRGLVFYGLRVRDGEEYEIGDMVYFFAFGDGTGAIVGKV